MKIYAGPHSFTNNVIVGFEKHTNSLAKKSIYSFTNKPWADPSSEYEDKREVISVENATSTLRNQCKRTQDMETCQYLFFL